MILNKFSKHDQDFAYVMAARLRLNRVKKKQKQTAVEKINQLTAEQNNLVKLGYNLFLKV